MSLSNLNMEKDLEMKLKYLLESSAVILGKSYGA
jgi:hypothetical protein